MDVSAALTIEFPVEPEDVGDVKYMIADILRAYAEEIEDGDPGEYVEILNGTVRTEVTMRPTGGQGWRKGAIR